MTSTPLFTAHDVPDLVAALPTRFGFVPTESLCLIATTGPRHRFGFSIRVDLPTRERDIPAMAQHVVRHLRRHGAEGAIIVAVSQRHEFAGKMVWCVEESLGSILPVVSAWATADRYWTTFDDCDPQGYPYELSPQHLALVQAIAAGQEILPDRQSLERRYLPEPSARRRWIARTIEATVLDISRRTTVGHESPRELGRRELTPVLEAALLGRTPSEGEVLRLLVWLTSSSVRTAAWQWINPETARDLLTLWAHVARLAPPGFEIGPLCLAALSAYRCGDGAQALIAADRARNLDPGDELARAIVGSLEQGRSPDEFERWSRRLREDGQKPS